MVKLGKRTKTGLFTAFTRALGELYSRLNIFRGFLHRPGSILQGSHRKSVSVTSAIIFSRLLEEGSKCLLNMNLNYLSQIYLKRRAQKFIFGASFCFIFYKDVGRQKNILHENKYIKNLFYLKAYHRPDFMSEI